MDLATAQQHLTASLDALDNARKAASYGQGANQVSRQTLTDLQDQVNHWQAVVDRLQRSAAGQRTTHSVAKFS